MLKVNVCYFTLSSCLDHFPSLFMQTIKKLLDSWLFELYMFCPSRRWVSSLLPRSLFTMKIPGGVESLHEDAVRSHKNDAMQSCTHCPQTTSPHISRLTVIWWRDQHTLPSFPYWLLCHCMSTSSSAIPPKAPQVSTRLQALWYGPSG